jgi:amino-acid N-acetyltransferase
VRKIDTEGIQRTLDMGALVLLSPFGFSPTGEAFNLTMEDVATSVAVALQADKLIFLTEVPGIRVDANDPTAKSTPNCPWPPPKPCWPPCPRPPSPPTPPSTCSTASGPAKAAWTAATSCRLPVDGALLLEIYTHDGIGTMVVDEKLESVREATMDDVSGIVALIEPFEKDGTLVKRDRTEIERDAGTTPSSNTTA